MGRASLVVFNDLISKCLIMWTAKARVIAVIMRVCGRICSALCGSGWAKYRMKQRVNGLEEGGE